MSELLPTKEKKYVIVELPDGTEARVEDAPRSFKGDDNAVSLGSMYYSRRA